MTRPTFPLISSLVLTLLASQPIAAGIAPADPGVLRVHLIYCTDAGQKAVDLHKVDRNPMPGYDVKDVARDELVITVPEGYYGLTLDVGRCSNLPGLNVTVLPGDTRDIVVTMLPRPGTEHHGELTILDVIPTRTGAIGGILPRDGMSVYLESKSKHDEIVAQVENRAYFFDNVPPGGYQLWVAWANWSAKLGPVTIAAEKVERKDISLDELIRNISDFSP